MSVTLMGYEGQPNSVQPSAEQVAWLNKMSEAIERDIVMEFCSYGSKPTREDDFEDSKIIRIYDAATSAVLNPEEGSPTATRERIEILRPGAQHNEYMQFSMRVPRGMRFVNTERMRHVTWANPQEETNRRDYPRVIAEYDYGTIWLRWPFVNYRRFSRETTMEAVLQSTDSVLDLLIGPLFEKVFEKDPFNAFRNEREKAARDHFLENAKRNATESVRTLLTRITATEQRMIGSESEASTAKRELKAMQEEYDFHEQNSGIDESKLSKEYDEIVQHTRLERLEFDEASVTLKFYTDTLYLYSPEGKERTPAGKFCLELRLGARDVIITNLTNQRGGRNHPHVPPGGRGCWGSAASLLEQTLGKNEILSFFQLAVEYLESYNPQDAWGRWAANWWLVQEEEFQQWLQADGSWLTKKEIKALDKPEKDSKKKEKELVEADVELQAALETARAQV